MRSDSSSSRTNRSPIADEEDEIASADGAAVGRYANGCMTVLRSSRRRGRMLARGHCTGCAGRGTGCTRWPAPTNAMLARLRSARAIKLHHPAARSEADVLAEWQSYLTRQGRRHYFWLGVNAVITPFATVLLHLAGSELDRHLVRLSDRSPHDRRVGDQPGCNGT